MKIILISCVSQKKQIKENETVKAKELYISQLFKKAWSYANKLNPDKIIFFRLNMDYFHPKSQ